jgi:hypothetical protein
MALSPVRSPVRRYASAASTASVPMDTCARQQALAAAALVGAPHGWPAVALGTGRRMHHHTPQVVSAPNANQTLRGGTERAAPPVSTSLLGRLAWSRNTR